MIELRIAGSISRSRHLRRLPYQFVGAEPGVLVTAKRCGDYTGRTAARCFGAVAERGRGRGPHAGRVLVQDP